MHEPLNILYVDIGNSCADCLFYQNGQEQFFKVRKEELSSLDFLLLKKSKDRLQNAFLSSVNHSSLQEVKKALLSYNPDMKISLLNQEVMREACNRFSLEVENIDILGGDLFADLVSRENHKGQIIIDLGTASKVLYLDANNKFHGSMIFPGLSSFAKMLNMSTDLLSEYPLLTHPPLLSLKTEECISSGVIHGTIELLSGTVAQIKEKYQNPNCEVILTGGNAKLILEVLREKPSFEYVYDERHVIHGLVRIHEKVELEVNI